MKHYTNVTTYRLVLSHWDNDDYKMHFSSKKYVISWEENSLRFRSIELFGFPSRSHDKALSCGLQLKIDWRSLNSSMGDSRSVEHCILCGEQDETRITHVLLMPLLIHSLNNALLNFSGPWSHWTGITRFDLP